MRNPRTIITASLFLCLSFIGMGQTEKQSNAYKNSLKGVKKIVIGFTNASIIVEAYEGSELIIEAKGLKPLPDKAKGLRPVYNTATDNTGVGLEANQEGDQLSLQRASSKSKVDYYIKLPQNMGLGIQELNWMSGDIKVTGVKGEVEIKAKNSNLKLTDVEGPIVAHTVSGNIDIVYSKLTASQPSSIVATSGYIDVTMPANTKADLSLSAVSGEVYTDFEINFSDKKKKEGDREHDEHGEHGEHDEKGAGQKKGLLNDWKNDCNCSGWGKKMQGKINGGGAEVSLKAISGNVYLRKKN